MANELSALKPVPGSAKKRVRIGRGQGSGHGKTAGKGTKGQKARTGAPIARGFEGGQIPLRRRLPKVGFRSPFKKEYVLVHVGDLGRFAAGSVVDEAALRDAGLARGRGDGVKLLGDGDLSVSLTVKVAKVSAAAKAKVEAAGGTVEEIA